MSSLFLKLTSCFPALQFWLGRELNPTIGSFDLKVFFELRPGLIGWVLINISCACEQAVRNGGKITDSMMLVLGFQGLYVLDALYNEVGLCPKLVFRDGCKTKLTLGISDLACCVEHHGRCDGWIWPHAQLGRYLLGSNDLFTSSAVLGFQPCRTWLGWRCWGFRRPYDWILDLPLVQPGEE